MYEGGVRSQAAAVYWSWGAQQWDLFQCPVQPRIRQHCCYGDLISTRTLALLPLYKQHTHTHLQGGCFYLNTVTHICSVIPFPPLTHMLCCKWQTYKGKHSAHICRHGSFAIYFSRALLSTPFVAAMHHLLHETSTSVILHPSAIQSKCKHWQATVWCTSLRCHREAAQSSVDSKPKTTNRGGGAVLTT